MKHPKTILIVDDEESIRDSFSGIFSATGYRVFAAKDADETLSQMNSHPVDLVYLDINLGNSSGLDLLAEIRQRLPLSPIIMITGNPDVSSASEAVRQGAFDYILKPITTEHLLHSAQLALQHKEVVEQRENYRSNIDIMFQSIPLGLVLVDQDQCVLQTNNKVLSYFKSASIEGENFSTLSNSLGKGLREAYAEFARTDNLTLTFRYECLVHGDARVFDFTVTDCKVPGTSNKGQMFIISDISRLNHLERELQMKARYGNIIGQSRPMQFIYDLLDRLVEVDSTVLVTGQSGTGKELIADALHYGSHRREGPLVKVNCAALPENLLESELFGHKKGAFTGAVKDRMGRFQQAHQGTIFLDEIGDISPALQVRLLRVLQEKEIECVGGDKPISVDVRVVAATNQNLLEKVKSGDFREDLYYRLRVLELMLPPLAERREDIPLLVEHFIAQFNNSFKRNVLGVTVPAMELLTKYQWPGNVRELKHTIERAFILCRNDMIDPSSLPEEIQVSGYEISQEKHIFEALKRCSGNKTAAAKMLGISRRHLHRKIKEMGHSSND